MDVLQIIEYPKYVQQPNYNNDYNDGIQNSFYGPLHRNEGVNKPENYSNSNKYKDDSQKWHNILI